MQRSEPRLVRPISQTFGLKGHQSVDLGALFVYGSLMFPEVLQALLDRVPRQSRAAVVGWQAAEIPDEVFPALVPAEDTTYGFILDGLTPPEWCLIDAFEDPVYELRSLDLAEGGHAWAYVCPDSSNVSSNSWNSEAFASEHLESYVANCKVWRQKYETGTT